MFRNKKKKAKVKRKYSSSTADKELVCRDIQDYVCVFKSESFRLVLPCVYLGLDFVVVLHEAPPDKDDGVASKRQDTRVCSRPCLLLTLPIDIPRRNTNAVFAFSQGSRSATQSYSLEIRILSSATAAAAARYWANNIPTPSQPLHNKTDDSQ